MSLRIFDHLDGAPEDRRFSVVARAMHTSSWWREVRANPKRQNEPAPVSGEIVARFRRRTGRRRRRGDAEGDDRRHRGPVVTRAYWSSSDTARIRQALVELTSGSPIDRSELFLRVPARVGLDVGERRLYRALRWAQDQGLVRRIVPQSWRDAGGYVRVVGRPRTSDQVSAELSREQRAVAA